MAPKRHSPMEHPPSASPSCSEDESSEEEINDKEQDPDQQQTKLNLDSEDEEYEDEDEDEEEEVEDEEEQKKKPSSQKPTPSTTQEALRSSDSEDSDSETHSGETQPSPTASDFTIKPIVSKPIDDPTKPKKPTSKPPAQAPKLAPKRPSESEPKESQKKKSKVSNGGYEDGGAVEEKKSAINRLWSEEDEIVIFKGMIDYQLKKGVDPYTDMGAFHEFIKKSLHVDVSKNQLMDKIRRLKKKYQNNAEKGEKGEDPVFSKPHDHKSFELSKKIWGGGGGGGGGDDVVDDNAKSNNKKPRKSVKVNNFVPSFNENGQELVLQEGLKEDFGSLYPRLHESLEAETSSYLAMLEPGKNVVKETLSLISGAKAKELEEKWKNLRVEEVALYLKRVELIRDQTKLVLDYMKSSKSS